MDKSENYHLSKSVQAERKGISIIHIFSDMWENRPNQVMDLIRKRLGKYKEILANTCALIDISKTEGYNFFNKYSVNVPDLRITDYLGYFKDNELLAVLGYSEKDKTIYDYLEAPGIKIKGGINIIFTLNFKFDNYIVRCDRSLSKQDRWKANGFVPLDCTKPKPYYTKDFKSRIRAFMIPMDESKLEKAGYKTIYDCGEMIMKKEKV